MFEGFTLTTIDTGEATIRLRHGGSGPPLLLLHGNPQTHVMWHKIANRLAEEFTVVAADINLEVRAQSLLPQWFDPHSFCCCVSAAAAAAAAGPTVLDCLRPADWTCCRTTGSQACAQQFAP